MVKNNILLILKPSGPTSHDIVDQVRKITGEKRVGHAGTLDPFAEGLLIVLVGREATKRQVEFIKLDKEYIATLRLGAESDTGDLTGSIVPTNATQVRPVLIRRILKNFIGEINQVPPAYSALKIHGRKAYELARDGKEVKLAPRKIKIYGIEVLNYKWPMLQLKINCSSGTYIRALARDIGKQLAAPSKSSRQRNGCGAYLEKLIRTKIGKYVLKDAVNLEELIAK